MRDAISASGGLGEPWCLDGANAVRVGDLLFVIEVDDLELILSESQEPAHFKARRKFQKVVDSMPAQDARPKYSPRPANPWDHKS